MKITVILCIFNQSKDDIILTLSSIISQKYERIQIIFADDNSTKSWKEDVEKFCNECNFLDYLYIYNIKNLGTVKNILNACAYADGDIIKPVGAGDFFTNSDVFKLVNDEFTNKNITIAFGKMLTYVIDQQKKIRTFGTFPIFDKCYKNGDLHQCLRNFLFLGDHICGATIFYKKDILIKYLNLIKDRIIYVEDYIPAFAMMDNIKIYFMDFDVVYYQVGTGISTSSKKTSDRIKNDVKSFEKLFVEYCHEPKMLNRYKNQLILNQSSFIARRVVKIIKNPKIILFQLKKNRNAINLIKLSDSYVDDSFININKV